MSLMTTGTTGSGFAHNPHYATGVADAYDEYMAGTDIHTLVRRSHEMLDAPTSSIPAELYLAGYANTIVALLNGHIATITAQTNVAHDDRTKARARRSAARLNHPLPR